LYRHQRTTAAVGDFGTPRRFQAALRQLKKAVEQNDCAYTALQTDPLSVKICETPEFAELISSAWQCQSKFLAERNHPVP
jgi:hypothetical protein